MKRFREFLAEQKKDPNKIHHTQYAPHPGYGFKGGKVLARRSGSSAGGDEELEEEQIDEVRLSRIHSTLEKGNPIGTVSPERGEMTKKQKKAAHKAIQKVLRRHSDAGMISFSGPHKGRYMYDKDAAPSAEGSYVLKPGNHPKAKENFHRILKTVGKQFGQESVLKVRKKSKEQKPTGAFHYTTGSKKGTVDSRGKISYNQPLGKDEGDTALKAGGSFTVKE